MQKKNENPASPCPAAPQGSFLDETWAGARHTQKDAQCPTVPLPDKNHARDSGTERHKTPPSHAKPAETRPRTLWDSGTQKCPDPEKESPPAPECLQSVENEQVVPPCLEPLNQWMPHELERIRHNFRKAKQNGADPNEAARIALREILKDGRRAWLRDRLDGE